MMTPTLLLDEDDEGYAISSIMLDDVIGILQVNPVKKKQKKAKRL